jgi:hypothetical protein
MLSQHLFIHHVYFWLARPGNKVDHYELLEGLKNLSEAPIIKSFHIGMPAGTYRDVIDTSYDFSWLLIFDSREDQDAYQVDPIHLEFVEKCKHLWQKVVVYDSISAY